MFSIYLPIAEIPVNIFLLLALGLVSGVLSGLFGVGGGFVMTPLLIFLGIPPAVAVSSSANQITASSFSGFLSHWRKNNVDFKMGTLLLIGGLVGSSVGVWLFALLKSLGQIDLVISLSYVFFLGGVGSFMTIESFKAIARAKRNEEVKQPRLARYLRRMKLPLKMHFPHSQLSISAYFPLLIGFVVGAIVSIMGVGGGFLMIPAMIYLLGMPTNVVVGTSLFQIIFITANVTFLQSLHTHTVDVVLAVILMITAVIGAQFGTQMSMRLRAEHLRVLLACIVLSIAIKLAVDLFVTPDDMYEVIMVKEVQE